MTGPASVRSPRFLRLRLILRVWALAAIVGAVAFWAANGAHRGWSQDRVPVNQTDEVTGLAYVTYEDRYVPGVEWIAGGVALAVVLFGVSFLFRSNSKSSNP